MRAFILTAIALIAFWLLPDYGHPLRASLREAGLARFAS